MDIDIHISRWILEFFLRQSVDDRVLDALFSVLPLPNDSSFRKIVLLSRLQSEIARGSVSERILGLMEHIEELHYIDGVMVPESMKAAYCAVAVNCTLRVLESDGDNNSIVLESDIDNKSIKYLQAVKKIWKDRVFKMEKADMAGLASDELRCWWLEIEAAVWDSRTWKNLLLRSKENDPLELVRGYAVEAWENMGPSFLELLASDHNALREVLASSRNTDCDPLIDFPSLSNSAHDAAAVINNNKDETKENGHCQNHVASRRIRRRTSGTSRGVRITDNEELGVGLSDKYKISQTPEIEKIQEALKSSTMELKAVVQDPLPDAIKIADTIIANMEREKENVLAPNLPDDKRENEADNDGGGHMNPKSRPTRRSLMEANGTACTYEWHDSTESLTEQGSSSEMDRPQLPTPKRRAVSPLQKYEFAKLTRRRKRKGWSNLEEDTLRTGVQKYGKGNWKLILNMYPDIFEERTEVDLKDKWRNMIRY